ncbi:MAG TPA: thermonuclease family protein [Spirochaetia bacterium]|nr:thermonuclease family protein [Spirochaetia bacterium]
MNFRRSPFTVSAALVAVFLLSGASTGAQGADGLYRVDLANIGSCYDADLARMLDARVYAYLEPGVLDVSLPHPPAGLQQRERVVLIGNSRGKDFPAAGSNSLRLQVLGKDILLAFDSVLRDSSGRLACYVYLPEDGTNVNLKLIRDGDARVDRDSPDFQFFQEFAANEQQAKDRKRGMWAQTR